MIEHGYASTGEGRTHYVQCGDGEPVLLLHQTPRSWNEYRDVIPILARSHRVIAMDTIGFGDSDKPDRPMSIEAFGAAAIDFIDDLGLAQFSLVGHHTGDIIATEVASRIPNPIHKLVLSGTSCPDPKGRERDWPAIDSVEERADGSHLTEFWQKRSPYYPRERPDLLHRLVGRSAHVGASGSSNVVSMGWLMIRGRGATFDQR